MTKAVAVKKFFFWNDSRAARLSRFHCMSHFKTRVLLEKNVPPSSP